MMLLIHEVVFFIVFKINKLCNESSVENSDNLFKCVMM